MLVRVLCLFLALLTPLLNRLTAGAGETRCLLVGCDRFVSMPDTTPAGENNTATMEEVLRAFLPGEISERRSVNGPGTVAGLEELIRDTFGDAKENDTALIYFSTHGILFQEDGRRHMALLLSDGEQEERLEPEQLRKMLDSVPGRKILILDACHSGAVIGAGADDFVNYFRGLKYEVLVSCGAEEDSWFWSTETDAYTGTGYFTAALENALRASDPEQIDPDGNGTVTLPELTARLREIHGASTVYCWPEVSGRPLFTLPEDREPGERLLGIAFGETEQDGDALVLPVHFRAEAPVKLMYQLIPKNDGQWDFANAVKLPDRERTGVVRGLITPGVKDRKIRLTRQSLGMDGAALLQIIAYRGEEMIPATEAGRVIEIQN
jgi:hypothetical protein